MSIPPPSQPTPGPDNDEFIPSYTGCSTYLLYFSRQKIFTTWLVTTAAQLREHVVVARSSPRGAVVDYTELPRLAATVVESDASIPPIIMGCVDYILRLREDWNDILQRRPNRPINQAYMSIYSSSMSNIKHAKALLAKLPVDSGRDEPPCPEPKDSYILPELPDEAFLAWVCFFDDLVAVREYLKKYWGAYKQSLETLTTCTLVTNTAIRLIRTMCESHINLIPDLPDVPDRFSICEWLFEGITGKNWRECVWRTDRLGNKECDQANWCCYGALRSIRYAAASINLARTRSSTWFPRGSSSIKKPIAVNPSGSGGQREGLVMEIVIAVCRCLHYMRKLPPEDPPFLPCPDEITAGWMKWEPYLDEQEIPLWLVISFQIWADILIQLGDYSPTALDDLKEQAEDSLSLFRSCLHHPLMERMGMRNKERYEGPDIFAVMKMIGKCVQRDEFKNIIETEFVKKKFRWTKGPPEDFFFIKIHPLFCGMQSWWLKQDYRYFESWAVRLHESIAPAALLYAYMYQSKLVDDWPNMNFVLTVRGHDILTSNRWEKPSLEPAELQFQARTVMECLKEQFYDSEEGPIGEMPMYRFLADIFESYFSPDRAVTSISADWVLDTDTTLMPSISAIVKRSVPLDDRKRCKKELFCDKVPNIIKMLELVTMACYYDEEYAAFDWFEENPRGLDYTPTSPSDGPYSLDALYYLLFDETSENNMQNLILAALCLEPSSMPTCEIPCREYPVQQWADGITRHAKALGISIQSAAAVFRPLIQKKGEAGRINAIKRQHTHYKTRGLDQDEMYHAELRARRCRSPWNFGFKEATAATLESDMDDDFDSQDKANEQRLPTESGLGNQQHLHDTEDSDNDSEITLGRNELTHITSGGSGSKSQESTAGDSDPTRLCGWTTSQMISSVEGINMDKWPRIRLGSF
ncbi:hypothetical protein F5Y10DRAFT_269769 [Nemania abortiva]|nr:hypothetical protein F5Y10DRAFT_269769 [Nemania abortiva]